ncbi:MAG: DUF4823 domain-containing protein [Betaproteobacteria bacterium]|nr:DUF4823 domain-containing protein [Betaproteobacteria bacterium]
MGLMAAVLASGCAATYVQRGLIEPTNKLSRDRPVLISTPANGVYGKTEYRASGQITATEVRAAFSRHALGTKVISECRDLQCLSRQTPSVRAYLVVPEILHWEDRATEWSGIPDRIEVAVRVYDSEAMNEVAATVISGKSKWATFGGDHPEDLLPEPLGTYVQALYE